MADATDFQLLQQYAKAGSEDAFKSLVDRHLNFVYSVAMSRLGNEAAAQDISQIVFAVLARKGAQLSRSVVLSGWLFQITIHACLDFQRTEARRKKRETEAVEQQIRDSNWGQFEVNDLGPIISTALASLSAAERDAILVRFLEERDFRQVGERLGISEAAGKMRVARGLEKLRNFLQKRGVTVSEATLCGAVPLMIQGAPAGLGVTIKTGVAIPAGLSPSNLALLKGVLKALAWAKARTAIVAGLGVLLVSGSATTLILQQHHRGESWIDLPRSSWTFAGYGSPQATIRTLEWAISRRDAEAVLACFSSDCLEEFREYLAQTKSAGSVDQLLLASAVPQQQSVSAVRILETEVLSTNQVLLHLSLQGLPKPNEGWNRFKKFGEEWKLDDLDPKGPNSRTGLPHPQAQYGGIGVGLDLDPERQAPRITKVLPNSPAAQAGLSPGMIVERINGTPTAGKALAESVYLTRGRVGSTVVLELFNPELRQTNMLELTRQTLTLSPAGK